MNATVHRGMRGKKLIPIPGQPPDLTRLPGCSSFAPRLPSAPRVVCKHFLRSTTPPPSIWRGVFCLRKPCLEATPGTLLYEAVLRKRAVCNNLRYAAGGA